MIIKEYYSTTNDGNKLCRTYSDSGYYIKKVGTEELYIEAVDLESSAFEYVETDIQFDEELITE